MRLSRLTIVNFRNLHGVDVNLCSSPVFVGSNGVGKSNLLHAIRLVLDPSLASRTRVLSNEDFSNHLGSDPMGAGHEVRVTLEITDFDGDPGITSALRHAIVDSGPLKARISYRFGPQHLEEGEEGLSSEAYGWSIYGGPDGEPRRIPAELRAFLHHEYLGALRDVESDLSSWRRSPLRRLLERAADDAAPGALAAAGDAITEANERVAEIDTVEALAARIGAETDRLVGPRHALNPTLRVGASEPLAAIMALRLLLDGTQERALRSASLGSLNVLYLALLEVEIERRMGAEIEHAIISIEEPEAHLHPHLQRRAFRKLHESDGPKRSTITTTHSAHIVSVTSPKRLVVLRGDDQATTAHAAIDASLAEKNWEDIERYLDTTRSELVFARRVLFAEGIAEQMLLPLMASSLDIDSDGEGITVCAVAGVNFEPYARFASALGIPWAVATDGDARGPKNRSGAHRMEALALALYGDKAQQEAPKRLFVGDETLELDLWHESKANQVEMLAALQDFEWGPQLGEELAQAASYTTPFNDDRVMHFVNAVSKGRFAQRLASRADSLDVPAYIGHALEVLSRP